MQETKSAFLEDSFRKLLTELVSDAALEADTQELNGSEKAIFIVEYIRGFTIDESTPSHCPACNSSFVTETLYSWMCADCGATEESPFSRNK